VSILAWIEDQRKLKLLNAPKYNHPVSDGSKGLWTRCDHCGVILYIKHLKENRRVCFGCGYHLQMNSEERITHLIDASTWRPLDEAVSPCDPLEFSDQKPYIERLKESQQRTGLQDAIQTGTGLLDGIPVALGVMDFYFMGGSMGSVVGEKITRLIEYATQEGLTLILVCASGGARMQEGVLSLMQMAKISAALQIYQSCANLLYISVITSPTTGGVTASFAMLGDLIFAEPKALIGFAGRRVIEQTLQEQLPDDFQTAEYLLHHGLVDLIIPRSFFKPALFETITLYKDAPLKRTGSIPHGVQQHLNFITEEKIRRKYADSKQRIIRKNASYSKIPVSEVTEQLGENYLEKLKLSYQNNPSEFLYREILTCFQSMFDFFALSEQLIFQTSSNPSFANKKTMFFYPLRCKATGQGKETSKNEIFRNKFKLNETLFNEFILKYSYNNFTSNSVTKKENLENREINTSTSKTNKKIIEWRILYSIQNSQSKKNFLDIFINGKHRNFFYKSLTT
jgi:acetyl-CoA carboxylase carboxyl transferase subunit beta